jgi:hypothetical protein
MIYINDELAINFRHITRPGKTGPVRATECEILKILPECKPEVLAKELAICHPDDQFNKEEGRKMALTRLLGNFWDREFRTKVWNAYKNNRLVKKTIHYADKKSTRA